MSVNKWFKKQYRTSEDAWLDEMNPARVGTPPIDTDIDDSNEVSFAPAGSHGRPLKGGYWFIRKSHREKVQEAINRDRERMRHAPTFVFRRSMSDGENHCSADSPLRSHRQQSLQRSTSARENPYSTGPTLRSQPPQLFIGRGSISDKENSYPGDSDSRTHQLQNSEQSGG